MAAPPAPPGSALARTVLAWNRSELAAVVCVGALIRHLWPLRGTAEYVALGVLGTAAMIWSATVTLTYRVRPPDRQLHLGEDVFRMMTAGALVFATAAFVLAFLAAP